MSKRGHSDQIEYQFDVIMHLSLALEFLCKKFGTTKEVLEAFPNDVKAVIGDKTKEYIEDVTTLAGKFGIN